MTQFTTITELEILNEAYMSILGKWAKEDERYQIHPHELTKLRRDKYKAKLDELHAAILALENANDLPDFNPPEALKGE